MRGHRLFSNLHNEFISQTKITAENFLFVLLGNLVRNDRTKLVNLKIAKEGRERLSEIRCKFLKIIIFM